MSDRLLEYYRSLVTDNADLEMGIPKAVVSALEERDRLRGEAEFADALLVAADNTARSLEAENATLRATITELREVLKAALHRDECSAEDYCSIPWHKMARAAIAKAEGESE